MSDELSRKLHSTTDGQEWADAFIGVLNANPPIQADLDRLGDGARDFMVSWFANAIETGRSAGYAAAKRETEPGWPVD
jgi:hypothetical protein